MGKIKKYSDYKRSVRIAFCGDTLVHQPVIDKESTRGYSFDGVFDEVADVLAGCDAVVVNLEGTFNGEPVGKVIDGKPTFSMPDKFAIVLSDLGVTHASVANNHTYDFGEDGFRRTLDILLKVGIKPIAGYLEDKILDTSVSFSSFTTHTNRDVPKDPSASIMDVTPPSDCDLKVAIPHWGGQFNLTPDEEQLNKAIMLKDMGFNIVIGSGPHVAHDVAIGNCVVAYSLGNFISDHQKPGRLDGGSIVILDINDGRIKSVEVYKIKASVSNGDTVIQVVGKEKTNI